MQPIQWSICRTAALGSQRNRLQAALRRPVSGQDACLHGGAHQAITLAVSQCRQPDLGTQVIDIKRLLAVVSHSLQQARLKVGRTEMTEVRRRPGLRCERSHSTHQVGAYHDIAQVADMQWRIRVTGRVLYDYLRIASSDSACVELCAGLRALPSSQPLTTNAHTFPPSGPPP